MATIYEYETGKPLSEGLQGSAQCDEAIRYAREEARDRQQPVVVEDDGEFFVVYPDGATREMDDRERRSGGWDATIPVDDWELEED